MRQSEVKATRAKRAGGDKLAPAIVAERANVINALHPVVQMLGAIVGPHIEVVLHDLMQPESSIIAIANGHISGRVVGDAIINGPKYDKGFAATKRLLSERGNGVHSVVKNYVTVSHTGQELKSATVVFRDTEGTPYVTLCMNADMSSFQLAHAWLERLLQPVAEIAPTRSQEPEMDTLMREIISDAVLIHSKPVTLMFKEEKVQAVQTMQQRGIFLMRGGVERAAAALHVTRFTIYNYLEELRRRDEAHPEPAGGEPEAAPKKAPRKKAAPKAGD